MTYTTERRSKTPLIAVGNFNSTRLDLPGAHTTAAGTTALSWLLGHGGFRAFPELENARGPMGTQARRAASGSLGANPKKPSPGVRTPGYRMSSYGLNVRRGQRP